MSKADRIKKKMERAAKRESKRQDRTGKTKEERVQGRKDKLGNLTQKLLGIGGVALGMDGGIPDIVVNLIKAATRTKEDKLKKIADLPPGTHENELHPIYDELDEANDIIEKAKQIGNDHTMDYQSIEIIQNDQNEWSVRSQDDARQAAMQSDAMMDVSIWSVKRVLKWSMVWIFLAMLVLAASYIFIANRELSLAINTIIGILIGNVYKERSQVLGFSVGSSSGSKIKSINMEKNGK